MIGKPTCFRILGMAVFMNTPKPSIIAEQINFFNIRFGCIPIYRQVYSYAYIPMC